jgi:hypothetical protein
MQQLKKSLKYILNAKTCEVLLPSCLCEALQSHLIIFDCEIAKSYLAQHFREKAVISILKIIRYA